jgi:diguanylate cyclase (GGDEF)-like protein
VDPLTVAVGVSAVAATAGLGTGWRLHRRLRRAQADTARLRREMQAERHAANHDSLTGLLNRRAFHRLGNQLVHDPVRPAVACVVVDLNSLKQINDTLGHAAGDQVLVTVAGRLATYAGDGLVARLGGDEFAGLFTRPSLGWELLYPAADQLAELLAEPMSVAGRSLRVTAAIGVAAVCRSTGLATALHHADCAMYRAKATGAGAACFTPALDDDNSGPPGGSRSARPRAAAPAPRDTARYRGGVPRSLVETAPGGDETPW